jgi:hypothetical protein
VSKWIRKELGSHYSIRSPIQINVKGASNRMGYKRQWFEEAWETLPGEEEIGGA